MKLNMGSYVMSIVLIIAIWIILTFSFCLFVPDPSHLHWGYWNRKLTLGQNQGNLNQVWASLN